MEHVDHVGKTETNPMQPDHKAVAVISLHAVVDRDLENIFQVADRHENHNRKGVENNVVHDGVPHEAYQL